MKITMRHTQVIFLCFTRKYLCPRAQCWICISTYVYVFNGLNIFRFVCTYVTMGYRMTISTGHTNWKHLQSLKFLTVFHHKYFPNISQLFPQYFINISQLFPQYPRSISLAFPQYFRSKLGAETTPQSSRVPRLRSAEILSALPWIRRA